MKYIYNVICIDQYNKVSYVECAFSTEEKAKNYIDNKYFDGVVYGCYYYDIEETELDPTY